MSSSNVDTAVNLHQVHYEPHPVPETKIVEAYGLQKCPKLVQQVAGDNLEVRVNALSVLCKEFNNPYSIFGCAQVGVIKVLASMVTDPDYVTRERASLALAIAAKDANGLSAILEDDAVGEILLGKNDPSEAVRCNVYECLLHVTRTTAGCDACNRAEVTASFVDSLYKEADPIRPVLLDGIHNLAGTEQGLVDALNCNAVGVCVSLIKQKECHINTVSKACRTLGFICFDERGKLDALECGAVPVLMELLVDRKTPKHFKSNVLMALMAITTTDEGKRQLTDPDGITNIVAMIYEDDRAVKLNVIKLLSNIAVFPPVRKLILENPTCVSMLTRISKSDDPLLKKHAEKALSAVNWKP